jgi:hypothetical protein
MLSRQKLFIISLVEARDIKCYPVEPFLLFNVFKTSFGTLVLINIIANISWTPFDTASVMKSIKNIGLVHLLNFSLGTIKAPLQTGKTPVIDLLKYL